MEDVCCDCSGEGSKSKSETRLKCDRDQERYAKCNRRVGTFSSSVGKWRSKSCVPGSPEGINRKEARLIYELEEKVNYLLEVFKGDGDNNAFKRATNDSDDAGNRVNMSDVVLSEIRRLLNFNKRLTAAEEAIENLTAVVHQILKKVEEQGLRESVDVLKQRHAEPVEPNEMSLVKDLTSANRNDLLTSLIKTFLKIGTVDEIYNKLALMPETVGRNNRQTDSLLPISGKTSSERRTWKLNEGEKLTFSPRNETEEPKHENQPSLTENNNLKMDGKESRYAGSKLEVISEQAEIDLQYKTEPTGKGQQEKDSIDLNEELFRDEDMELSAKTTRLLAQEALLKSSLDKVHFELFSNLNSSEKAYLKSSSFATNETEVSTAEERSVSGTEENVESLSEDKSTSSYEVENVKKNGPKETFPTSIKYSKLSDFKEAFSNALLRNAFSKSQINATKEEDRRVDCDKSRFARQTAGRDDCVAAENHSFRPPQRSPDFSRGRRKADPLPENVRPATVPCVPVRKSIPSPSDLKKLSSPSKSALRPAAPPDKIGKREIYKSSNKNLLNKKIFVQAS